MRFPASGKVRFGWRLPAAMEGLWLVTVLAIPIVIAPQDAMIFHYQLPKIVLLRGMVSLMAALWLLRWLSTQASPIASHRSNFTLGWHSFKRWISAQPDRLLLVGVLAFVCLNFLSAIFSVAPGVSTWGGFKVPDGYGLHNVAAYVVFFLIIARCLTSRAQVWRLLAAVAASGGTVALIGVLQRINVLTAGAPLTSVDGAASTLGDPLVLGAYLALTVPVTIGLAAIRISRGFSFGEQGLWVLLIAVQMLALAYSLSLSAAVGLIVALSAFLAFGYFMMAQAAAARVAAVSAVAVAVTIIAMSFVPDLPDPAESETVASSFDETEFLGIAPEPDDGVLSGRAGVWATSAELITSRPSLPSGGGTVPGLRFLLGYGPDTYAYVFPLKATGDVGMRDDAGNAFIHRTVELGLLGGLSTLALYALAVAVMMWLLLRHRDDITPDHRIVMVLLMAVLTGRFAQQMLEVGSAGDTLLFWALLALVPAAHRAWPLSAKTPSSEIRSGPVSVARPLLLRGASVGLALLITVAMAWLITDKGINVVRADVAAAKAQKVDATEQRRAEGLALFDVAIELAPDLPTYYRMRGDFLVAVTETVPPGLESNADLEEIYADRAMALQIDPLAGESLLDMANSAFDLTRAGYEGLDVEAVEQYNQLMALSPNFSESHTLLWVLLAIAYMDVNRAERALEFLDNALDLDSSDFTRSKVLFVQGTAYSEVGELDNAIDSFNLLLEIGADPLINREAHRLLAKVYSAADEPQLASDHYEQYVQLRDSDQT